jgi:UDP-glucose 4-epimerase
LVDALLAAGVGRVIVVDNFFLGSRENLAAASIDERLQICELDGTDGAALASLIDRQEVETVFNLAVIPLPASLQRPRWSVEVNVSLTLNLLELQKVGAFQRLVHFSSSEAYGSAQRIPMDEEHPLSPATPYAASKAAADHLVSGYGRTFGLETITVRPFNNYGPRQNARDYAGIIPTALKRIYRGEPTVIFGDGQQTRDYIFAPDTAALTLRLVNEPRAWGHTINIASGREISMLELVRKLIEVAGTNVDIQFQPERPGDVHRHVADIRQAASLLGGSLDLTDFDAGIAETVSWYKSEFASNPALAETSIVDPLQAENSATARSSN